MSEMSYTVLLGFLRPGTVLAPKSVLALDPPSQ